MNYHTITKEDMVNGPGLRAVLWVSGCEHHCQNCHNPETWCRTSGEPFDEAAEALIFEELAKEHISGITISGGDPLAPYNREQVTEICKKIRKQYNLLRGTAKKPCKTIWVYTGYLYEEVKDLEIMKYINVLVDGEFKQALYSPNLDWKGSANQRVINIPKTREAHEVILEY